MFVSVSFTYSLKENFSLDRETLEPSWQVTGSKLLIAGKADANFVQLNPMVN